VNFKWNSESYQSKSIKTNLIGKYNFANFLAALAIGNEFKVSPELMGRALEEYVPSNNRSQIQKTERNTLIVDCYNANATSMAAALQSFVETKSESKLAILGDMRELGVISGEEHQKVIDFLKKNQINAFLVGSEMSKIQCEYPKFENADELIEEGLLSKVSDTVILIKGSRGIRLEKLISYL
jgi:UDP-N-acetylmuramoyl-tripeptide--D-alanyl-D-alanine ligase